MTFEDQQKRGEGRESVLRNGGPPQRQVRLKPPELSHASPVPVPTARLAVPTARERQAQEQQHAAARHAARQVAAGQRRAQERQANLARQSGVAQGRARQRDSQAPAPPSPARLARQLLPLLQGTRRHELQDAQTLLNRYSPQTRAQVLGLLAARRPAQVEHLTHGLPFEQMEALVRLTSQARRAQGHGHHDPVQGPQPPRPTARAGKAQAEDTVDVSATVAQMVRLAPLGGGSRAAINAQISALPPEARLKAALTLKQQHPSTWQKVKGAFDSFMTDVGAGGMAALGELRHAVAHPKETLAGLADMASDMRLHSPWEGERAIVASGQRNAGRMNAVAQSYLVPIRAGHPGQAVGRLGVDVLSGYAGGKALSAGGKALKGAAQAANTELLHPRLGITARALSVGKLGPEQVFAYRRYVAYASKYGKKVKEYGIRDAGPLTKDMSKVTDPGDVRQLLRESRSQTFGGAKYSEFVTTRPMRLYRTWSPEQSFELGGFWQFEKPAGALPSRIDAAVDFDWGWKQLDPSKPNLKHNLSQSVRWVEIEVPVGTRVFVGEAGYQRLAWAGGGSQIVFDEGVRVPKEWKQAGGKLK